MTVSPQQHFEPKLQRVRGIPWFRWLGIAFVIFAALTAGVYWWAQSYTTITVAADTTYLTTPLLADGYPDYMGCMNAQNSQGVTPENNAWVAILRSVGPQELRAETRAEHFRLLGIEAPPDAGNYVHPFYNLERAMELPDEVLIAASAAAQVPFHIRFVNLAAANANRFAQLIGDGTISVSSEDFVLPEFLAAAVSGSAEAINEYALDPLAGDERAELMATPPGIVVEIGEAEQIQDLREAALNLIKPMFADAEEETVWRREIFHKAAEKLLEHEKRIIEQRPWSRAECPLAAHWLDQNAAPLQRLSAELQKRTRFYVPLVPENDTRAILALILPQIETLRSLSQGYRISALHCLQREDLAGAIENCEAQFRLAAYCQTEPLLVETLIMYGLHGMAAKTMAEIVQHRATTEADLQALSAILQQPPNAISPSRCIDVGERFMALDCVIQIVVHGENGFHNDRFWDQTIICWNDVLRELNQGFDQLTAAVKTGDIQVMQKTSQQLAANPQEKQLREWYKQRPWYLLPSQRTAVAKFIYRDTFIPGLAASYQAHLRTAIRHDLARVYLALERFRRAQGSYPAVLTELVPVYLPAVPNDPIDGQPLRYRRMPEGGYRAYSIWVNGIDDGGIPIVEIDGEILSSQENDLVIGSPEEITLKQLFGW